FPVGDIAHRGGTVGLCVCKLHLQTDQVGLRLQGLADLAATFFMRAIPSLCHFNTRSARSVFQWLRLPTGSMSKVKRRGSIRFNGQSPFWWRRSFTMSIASATRSSGLTPALRK